MPMTSTVNFGSVSVKMRFSAAVKVVFPDAEPPAIPTTMLCACPPDASSPISYLLDICLNLSLFCLPGLPCRRITLDVPSRKRLPQSSSQPLLPQNPHHKLSSLSFHWLADRIYRMHP